MVVRTVSGYETSGRIYFSGGMGTGEMVSRS